MTLDELRGTNARAILFECIAGSRAYGTSNAASDEDLRGVFAVPGEYGFEAIMRIADELMAECEALKAGSALPELCDTVRASKLLAELTDAWERRT